MADFPPLAAPSSSITARKPTVPLLSFPRSSSRSSQRSVAVNPLIINTNVTSRRTLSPEILAPAPQRHLIESNASHAWLHTPPLSPASSRAISPTSTQPFSPQFQITHAEHDQYRFGAMAQSASAMKAVSKSETAMGRRWIRWSHKRGMRASLITLTFIACVFLKLCLGLGSYSGENVPPMYGDYEAQRHWMELTIHLPINQWYKYDLQYWGLDYPPLTAYVSWICGIVAHSINPAWVALASSRGIETSTSKLFMRVSVIAFDAVIYVPALFLFSQTWFRTRSKRTQDLAFLVLMLQPALFLVDFGHFQYNSVMLGFAIMTLNCFATGHDLLGAVFFVLSLGFKQMALYYAPAIGSYLVAKCVLLGPKDGGRLFVRLGLTTVATFTLLFLPWIPPFSSSPFAILDPISRMFPFGRGLFEDKVANFWCASNVVMKWKKWAAQDILVKASAALTLLGFFPSVAVMAKAAWDLNVWVNPTKTAEENSNDKEYSSSSSHTTILPLLPYALLNSSMSFFLFSFQVHEKTILLPLMPLMLLFSGATPDSPVYLWGALGCNTAVFSMWPLLRKDGLSVQYFVSMLLWNRLIGHNPFKTIYTILSVKTFVHFLSAGVYVAIIFLHFLEPIITPPARYPDLFPVLNVLVSTPVFVCLWLWSIKRCVQVSWAITGPSGSGAFGVEGHEDKIFSKRSSFQQSKNDRTRTVSLGFAQAKRSRRLSTRSAAGASSALPSSFRGHDNGIGGERGNVSHF